MYRRVHRGTDTFDMTQFTPTCPPLREPLPPLAQARLELGLADVTAPFFVIVVDAGSEYPACRQPPRAALRVA